MPIYRMAEKEPFFSSPVTEPLAIDTECNGATYLYFLYDPTEQPSKAHYIGVTQNPYTRLAQHITTAKYERNLRERWLNYVLQVKGVEPIMEIRRRFPNRWEAEEKEESYIRGMRKRGYWLANRRTMGG